jgi:hypothetical protein
MILCGETVVAVSSGEAYPASPPILTWPDRAFLCGASIGSSPLKEANVRQ